MAQKIYLTYEQQIEHLKNRKDLIIQNTDYAYSFFKKSDIILSLAVIKIYSNHLLLKNIFMVLLLKKSYTFTFLFKYS